MGSCINNHCTVCIFLFIFMGETSMSFYNLFNRIFGTASNKLVRTDDPDTSHQSANAVDSVKLEQLVYETIKKFGDGGCISDQVRAMHPTYPYSSITARYRALLDKGFIVDTGERRKGKSGKSQRVLIARVET
jgi:hypothetical protein